MVIYLVLGTALLISLITDIKSRKILNIVTLPSIAFAFIYYISTSGFEGLLFSGKGFLVGFGLLLIPYLLGGMGAGDVKLMAAIGALMGTKFVLYAFVFIAIIGGFIGAFLIIRNKGLINSLKSFFFNTVYFRSEIGSALLKNNKESSISFPYGVAIVLGTVCAITLGGY